MYRRLLLGALAAAPLLPRPAAAHGYTAGEIEIGHPWSRAAGQGATGAGFMSFANKGTTADRLTSARAAIASRVEIHVSEQDAQGVMRMRHLADGLAIPPGQTVKLEPGAFHIMLIGLKEPLAQGARVPLTLVFEKAGEVTVDLAVEAAGARGGHTH